MVFMKELNKFNEQVSSTISSINTPTISLVLAVVLILYSGYFVDQISPNYLMYADNTVAKIGMLVLIGYLTTINPIVGLLSGIAFLITLIVLKNKKTDKVLKTKLEGMDDLVNTLVDNVNNTNNPSNQSSNPITNEFDMSKLMKETKSDPNQENLEYNTNATGYDQDTGLALGQSDKQPEMCAKKSKYRDSFYPQYVNEKMDAYKSRYTGNEVLGFDNSAGYASL